MTNERAIELLHRLQDEQFDGEHGDERREALEMAVRALVSQQTVNDSQGLVNDCISRKAVMKEFADFVRKSNNSDFAQTPTWNDAVSLVGSMPSVQPQVLACGSGELVQESDSLVKDLVKDCISRKMAIDAFEPEHDTDWYTPQIIEVLEALPPVQPTQTNADSTQSNTLDCVSRRAAMIVIENSGLDDDSKDTVVRVLEQLPSAQPERQVELDGTETNIEILSELRTQFNCFDEVEKPCYRALSDAICALSAQPERKKGRWIWWYEEEFTEHATEYTPHCKCSECGRECAPSVATYSNFCRNCGADMRGKKKE